MDINFSLLIVFLDYSAIQHHNNRKRLYGSAIELGRNYRTHSNNLFLQVLSLFSTDLYWPRLIFQTSLGDRAKNTTLMTDKKGAHARNDITLFTILLFCAFITVEKKDLNHQFSITNMNDRKFRFFRTEALSEMRLLFVILMLLILAFSIRGNNLPDKFFGKFSLDHSDNFDAYLTAKG